MTGALSLKVIPLPDLMAGRVLAAARRLGCQPWRWRPSLRPRSISHTINAAPATANSSPPGRPNSNAPTSPPSSEPPIPTTTVMAMLIGLGPGDDESPEGADDRSRQQQSKNPKQHDDSLPALQAFWSSSRHLGHGSRPWATWLPLHPRPPSRPGRGRRRCHPSIASVTRLNELKPLVCQQFVSRRHETPGLLTDSIARSVWSDRVWTAFTALSRWRHGFEPRWGCEKKDQLRRPNPGRRRT